MNLKNFLKVSGALLALSLFTRVSSGQTIYSQSTTNNCATGTNLVEQSATPLTVATFRTDVATAWTNDVGGVFDFPTAIVTGTTVFRGAYGKSAVKRMQMTSSVSMQNSTSGGGTIYPISPANVATSSANQSDYNLALGVFDPTSGLPLSGETIKEIGFVVLSRTAAAWPLDIVATVTFTDGSTQSVRTNIAAGRGLDDTFYGFTAASGLGINNIRLQSFSPGTTNLVADRMSFDDFGFVTGPSTIVLAPQIINVAPTAYAIYNASNGIHFSTLTYENLQMTNLSVVLNSNNITSQLTASGSPTNYSFSYTGLVPNTVYTLSINVTNSGGTASLTETFNTANSTFTVYNSGGFEDPTLYPDGNLLMVTNNQAVWTPDPTEPGQIVNVGDPHDNVLERENTGATRVDTLSWPPISAGTLTIDFDAFVSSTSDRTIDISIQPTNGGTTMGPYISWGTVAGDLTYYNNVSWLPIAPLPNTWHHIQIIDYLSGPAAGKYDVLMNGTPVAQKLNWRNAPVGSAFNQFRLESVNTSPFFDYGQIDNLVITAGPEDDTAYPPPTITNVVPFNDAISQPTNGLQFQVLSQLAIGASNITLVLNSNDVSAQMVVTGTGTNLLVSYTNLTANQVYSMQITITNAVGTTSFSNTFYAYNTNFVLYDSGGFSDDALYPLGPLGPVTNGTAYWVPAAIPAQIVDSGNTNFGKVLQRAQVGTDQIDNLKFSPISSGIITYSYDLSVSDTLSRTVDLSLEDDGAAMTSFILCASNVVNYITPGGALIPSATLDTNWHHFKVVNRLSGSGAGTYDLYMDGLLVVGSIGWRSAIAVQTNPLDQLRVGAIRGTTNSYGNVDNLLVIAGPEQASTVIQPFNLTAPKVTSGSFGFSFQSQTGVNYAVQYKTNLTSGTWATLLTVSGDGSVKSVTDTNAPQSAVFYRVTTQ